MITFDPPITIKQPPYTNPTTNKVITPEPKVLTSLDLVYIDNPQRKTVVANSESLPLNFLIFSAQSYDDAGDWTQEQAEAIVKIQMGKDPQTYLQNKFPVTMEQHPNGPGSVLSGMLKTLGINPTPNCSCRQNAINMNIKGPDWCEQNMDTIIGWLKDESTKRNLPFIDMVARAMVKKAIKTSRRLLAKESVVNVET
jgi:hypothetical protein